MWVPEMGTMTLKGQFWSGSPKDEGQAVLAPLALNFPTCKMGGNRIVYLRETLRIL